MLTTTYTIPSRSAAAPFTIAVVADLHEHDPAPVLAILQSMQPDVIAVPGDLFERHKHGQNLDRYDKSLVSRFICNGIHMIDALIGGRWFRHQGISTRNSYRFLKKASKIAPVVMCLGNHEVKLRKRDLAVMEKYGVQLLNNRFVEIKGVLFGGIPSRQNSGEINHAFLKEYAEYRSNRTTAPFGSPESQTNPQPANANTNTNTYANPNTNTNANTNANTNTSGQTTDYKVLLCHHPEYYPELCKYGFDLVLSGHCHGGQIRILGHGIFAPGQGLLPKYHHGIYHEPGAKGCMVVSSGCANTASVPRWGNEEEVVEVKIG